MAWLQTYWVYLLLVFIALFVVFLTLYLQERNNNIVTSPVLKENQHETPGESKTTEPFQNPVVPMSNEKGYVTVDLRGGLGNQLFQIATGYAYGLEHNKALIFNHSVKQLGNRSTYFDTVFRWTQNNPELHRKNWHTISEPHFHYAKIPGHFGNVNLLGYFQSVKYFKEYLHDLITLISSNIPPISPECSVLKSITGGSTEGIAQTVEAQDDEEKPSEPDGDRDLRAPKLPTVSMHIRRSDYVGNPMHPVQPISYYQKAIEAIQKKTGESDLRIVVFSDDIAWCKKTLPATFSNLSFCDDPTLNEAQELKLMSLCDHHIIANSSFSWWGAVLDEKRGSQVVAPAHWFNSNDNWQDVYCDGWIVV